MSKELTYDGKFNLILGNMWSGKTSELIRRYNRHTIGGRNCLMIKYKNDIRYDDKMVVTHDGIKINAFVCDYLYKIDNLISEYDVICVDEVQFYKDAHIFIDKWANMGKIVEACGLNGNFHRQEFPIISKLIPIAENIVFLKAVCKETGKDCVYSNLNIIVEGNETEIIGGSEKYNAVDRKTYYKDKDFYTLGLVREFILLYVNKDDDNVKIGMLDNEDFDNKLQTFIQTHTELDLNDMVIQFLKSI